MSAFIGLPSSTPVRARGLPMNCPRWLPSTVARSQTPGRTLLRPPEKPAKKCGSMKPSATSSSVSAASLSMTSGVPEGRRPISTFAPASPQSWTTTSHSARSSGPSLASSSEAVVARWKPVATSRVTRMPGLPSRSSRSMLGRMSRLGTGRVWSEIMMTQFFLPRASSESRGEPMGASIAARTISAPGAPERSPPTRERRTGASPGSNSRKPRP